MIFRILTTTEYENYKFIIPKPSRSFWLDPCGIPGTNYPVVNDTGRRDRFGQRPDCETVSFRPVIETAPSDGLSYTPGCKTELFGYRWTAVQKNILVCDSCIGETMFNETPCLYKDSYLNYRINTYFNELKNQRGMAVPYNPENKSTGTSLSVSANEENPDLFPDSEILGCYEKSKKSSGFTKFLSILGVCLMGYGLVDFGIGVGSLSLMSFIPAAASFLSGSVILGAATILRNNQSRNTFREELVSVGSEYEAKLNRLTLDKDSPVTLKELQNSSEGGNRPDKEFSAEQITENSSNVSDESALQKVSAEQGKNRFDVVDCSKITDGNIKEKFKKINLLIRSIASLQNKSITQKLKVIYIPEIQKLYDIYLKYDSDGIESEGKDTFLSLLNDNLEKTIRLLTIEYDKAHERDIMDINFQNETMNKMLKHEKAIKDFTLKL